jgi:hypothetical protein
MNVTMIDCGAANDRSGTHKMVYLLPGERRASMTLCRRMAALTGIEENNPFMVSVIFGPNPCGLACTLRRVNPFRIVSVRSDPPTDDERSGHT